MSTHNRPVSPHIQIYRPQITSVLSILHRITGIVLAVGSIALALWLSFLAYDPYLFLALTGYLINFVGATFLLVWIFALIYHLCNGVRHLFWDAGIGFELPALYRSGWLVVASSLVLTVGIGLVIYSTCN